MVFMLYVLVNIFIFVFIIYIALLERFNPITAHCKLLRFPYVINCLITFSNSWDDIKLSSDD